MRQRTHRTRMTRPSSWARLVGSISLAAVVAIGGAALSYYQTRRTSLPASSTVQEVTTKKEALPPNLDGVLPVTAIQEVARSAGGSPVTNVALENRSGVLVYVTTLSDGTKLGFNAASGNAVQLEDDNEPASKEKKTGLPADFPINTSFEQARKLAQDAFPSGKISQIQLSTEGDIVTLNVGFADMAQVNINAANGNVIRVTTPTGATAEVPAGDPSLSPPAPDSSGTDRKPSTDGESGGTGTSPDRPDSSDKATVHIDGILTLANGIYTVTDDDATYTVLTDQDISGLVGKTVRVDGKLQAKDMIQATKVEPRRS